MPLKAFETPKCNEQPAIDEKPLLSQEDGKKVKRYKRRIEDLLQERQLSQSGGKGCDRKYKCEDLEEDDQITAVVYIVGDTKEEYRRGPAVPDLVTAHVKLLEEIKAEKSSKQ
ncbi:uncharacterized protein J4E88_005730 [Alternaria novae-zelandiae]|uniref:uncharacterized protein n=1 Tax=Alternaria novae-zelandiae TaxID=430562 RepID=UPI0020C4DE3C|nr:uncharacterized protein J4E88_005730 [Alternaria novae-zelandiae]KAI4681223.1 hypothetical protein J4E88_005730 [Alternaria novae-zelandiae]